MPFTPTRRHLHPVILALVAVLLLVLSSCSRGDSESPSVNPVVKIGVENDPKTLNPLAIQSVQAADIISLMFLKLMEEQADFLNFEPALARRWEFSEDSLTITFYLRDDVTWHDGQPVTAADVRFTWELQTDTTVAWKSRHIKERIRDVEVIDKHTVRYTFASRYPYQLMDANDGVIVPKHVLGTVPRDSISTHAFGRAPVGNGPYKLSRWPSCQVTSSRR